MKIFENSSREWAMLGLLGGVIAVVLVNWFITVTWWGTLLFFLSIAPGVGVGLFRNSGRTLVFGSSYLFGWSASLLLGVFATIHFVPQIKTSAVDAFTLQAVEQVAMEQSKLFVPDWLATARVGGVAPERIRKAMVVSDPWQVSPGIYYFWALTEEDQQIAVLWSYNSVSHTIMPQRGYWVLIDVVELRPYGEFNPKRLYFVAGVIP